MGRIIWPDGGGETAGDCGFVDVSGDDAVAIDGRCMVVGGGLGVGDVDRGGSAIPITYFI